MITKYTYGNPFQTDAVVQKLEVQNGNVPYFTVVKTEEQLQFEYTLENEERVKMYVELTREAGFIRAAAQMNRTM